MMHREAWTQLAPRCDRVQFAVAVVLSVLLSACGAPHRIVAIGDVHGDLAATRSALRLAGAIDADARWIGGKLIVVQTGDDLDRGDDEREILDLFEKLREEAKAAGGAFHALLGNHEVMNATGDFRYVTEGGFADFAEFAGGNDYDPDGPRFADLEPRKRGRRAAFLPGGPYARVLANWSVILQVENTIFVHGGVLPAHVTYGIDRINAEARNWLLGQTDFPDILFGRDSPEWTRLYSREPDAAACDTLRQVLAGFKAERMVVGHTVQPKGIASACDGLVWRIDSGMSAWYGGPVEVLEIVGDSVRVLGVNYR